MPIFRVQNHHALPQIINGAVISARSQHIQAQMPVGNLHFTWSRPLDVTVLYPDGREQHTSIIDVTRLAQIGIVLLGLLGAAFLRRIVR